MWNLICEQKSRNVLTTGRKKGREGKKEEGNEGGRKVETECIILISIAMLFSIYHADSYSVFKNWKYCFFALE